MKLIYLQALLAIITISISGCARKRFYAETPVADATVYQQLQQNPTAFDSVTVQAGKHYKPFILGHPLPPHLDDASNLARTGPENDKRRA